jgi:hypothetical protein
MALRALLCSLLLWLATAAAGSEARPGRTPYDPARVETIRGEIVGVERIPSVGGDRGLRLLLRTDDGVRVPVALGPAWVAEKQAFTLLPGDRVDVTGWRVVPSKPPVAAAEVRKGDATLRLRDARGTPVWRRPSGRPR